MVSINTQGTIVAHCPGCDGAKSSFEHRTGPTEYGVILKRDPGAQEVQFRLYRCAGCGRGGLGKVKMKSQGRGYPGDILELLEFFPDSAPRLAIPNDVPPGITQEFREAERCMDAQCYRAAAALFRSVLDKTMRANGYKTDPNISLYKQVENAAVDGVLTPARRIKAQEEIRVLGNDVLHDEWVELKAPDVELAHHYAQRILEDFYDDRPSVLKHLKSANRIPDEFKSKTP